MMLSFTHLNPPNLIYCMYFYTVSTMIEKNTFFGDFAPLFLNFIPNRSTKFRMWNHANCIHFFFLNLIPLFGDCLNETFIFFLIQYWASDQFRSCSCTDIHALANSFFSLVIDMYWYFFNEIFWQNKMWIDYFKAHVCVSSIVLLWFSSKMMYIKPTIFWYNPK